MASNTSSKPRNGVKTQTVEILTPAGTVETVTVTKVQPPAPNPVDTAGYALATRQQANVDELNKQSLVNHGGAFKFVKRQPLKEGESKVGLLHTAITSWIANEARSILTLFKMNSLGLRVKRAMIQEIDGKVYRHVLFATVTGVRTTDEGKQRFDERYYVLTINPDYTAEFDGLDYPLSRSEALSAIQNVGVLAQVNTALWQAGKQQWKILDAPATVEQVFRPRHDQPAPKGQDTEVKK